MTLPTSFNSDTSEAGASGGPFPQIDASEFQYELNLFECSGQQHHKCLVLQRSPALATATAPSPQGNNVFVLPMLRPATDYQMRIRASLPERDLYGSPSEPVVFRTHPTKPDPPSMPKVVTRQACVVHVQWRSPANNGSPINSYQLQMARGKDAFRPVYNGPDDNTRIADLEVTLLPFARCFLIDCKFKNKTTF